MRRILNGTLSKRSEDQLSLAYSATWIKTRTLCRKEKRKGRGTLKFHLNGWSPRVFWSFTEVRRLRAVMAAVRRAAVWRRQGHRLAPGRRGRRGVLRVQMLRVPVAWLVAPGVLLPGARCHPA